MTTLSFPIREFWMDIGKPEDYERANLDYNRLFHE
jgi:NDP-sugar pyrophosphorylase family protein